MSRRTALFLSRTVAASDRPCSRTILGWFAAAEPLAELIGLVEQCVRLERQLAPLCRSGLAACGHVCGLSSAPGRPREEGGRGERGERIDSHRAQRRSLSPKNPGA